MKQNWNWISHPRPLGSREECCKYCSVFQLVAPHGGPYTITWPWAGVPTFSSPLRRSWQARKAISRIFLLENDAQQFLALGTTKSLKAKWGSHKLNAINTTWDKCLENIKNRPSVGQEKSSVQTLSSGEAARLNSLLLGPFPAPRGVLGAFWRGGQCFKKCADETTNLCTSSKWSNLYG